MVKLVCGKCGRTDKKWIAFCPDHEETTHVLVEDNWTLKDGFKPSTWIKLRIEQYSKKHQRSE